MFFILQFNLVGVVGRIGLTGHYRETISLHSGLSYFLRLFQLDTLKTSFMVGLTTTFFGGINVRFFNSFVAISSCSF